MAGAQPPEGVPPAAPPGAPPPPVRAGPGSPMVVALKIFAIVSGVLALLMIVLMGNGRITTPDSTFLGLSEENLWVMGIVFGVMGLAFGAIGVFIGHRRLTKSTAVPPLDALMLGIGTICLLFGGMFSVANDSRFAEVTNLSFSSLLYIILYAWFMVWFVELGSTAMRYAVVDDYIKKHGIIDFSLNPVLGMYFLWFFVLMTVVLAWSALIVWLTPAGLVALTESAGHQVLADSIMFNSVYSVAISMAIWFTIMGLCLTAAYSFVKDKKTEVVEVKDTDY